ncbi:MAG: sulfoxide reductase catalytic subunit YedY, partial [Polaromonas sp.]
MLIKTNSSGVDHSVPSDITPQGIYQGRRDLIKLMATGAAGAALAGWAGREAMAQAMTAPGKHAALAGAKSAVAGAVTMDKLTDYKDASTYNNFYEFGTDKADPSRNAGTLQTRPWTVSIEGLVKQPKTYGIEELLKL